MNFEVSLWSNTVLGVWYILSIEIKQEKYRKNLDLLTDQISKRHYGYDLLDELVMSLKCFCIIQTFDSLCTIAG